MSFQQAIRGTGSSRKILLCIDSQREIAEQCFGPVSVPFPKEPTDLQTGGIGRALKKLNRVIEITQKTLQDVLESYFFSTYFFEPSQ